MSYKTTIRIAPLTTLERVDDPNWAPDRTLYDSLKFWPDKSTVPLLVDHDESRELGVVRSLIRFEDVDGPWLVAVAEIPGDPPPWLRRGVGASFGFKLSVKGSFAGRDIVRSGYLTEVSVLLRQTSMDPGARVLTHHPTVERRHARQPEGEVSFGGPVLRRYFDTPITVR